jgi:hypothetical protein
LNKKTTPLPDKNNQTGDFVLLVFLYQARSKTIFLIFRIVFVNMVGILYNGKDGRINK